MKSLGRTLVWWPCLAEDIERICHNCQACTGFLKSAAETEIHPNPWPNTPWQVLHIDLAGPFQQHNFLVLVDQHSRWPEVKLLKSTDTSAIIVKLRDIFVNFGIPNILISDNGPQFVSAEFYNFCKSNGITHRTVSPYHPRSNGLVVRFIRTFKTSLLKTASESTSSRSDLKLNLQNLLFQYRTIPHSLTGRTPAELLQSRKLRTKLDVLHPDDGHVVNKQQRWIEKGPCTHREFVPGEQVLLQDFRASKMQPQWLTGIIREQVAPLTFRIATSDGTLYYRHVDHMRKSHQDSIFEEPPFPSELPPSLVSIPQDSGVGPDLLPMAGRPHPTVSKHPNDNYTPNHSITGDVQSSPFSRPAAGPLPVDNSEELPNLPNSNTNLNMFFVPEHTSSSPPQQRNSLSGSPTKCDANFPGGTTTPTTPNVPRYPSRPRHQPVRLGFDAGAN
jgi:hypothetical protein